MKIVDAVWEKKNLGVNTVEITFENDDKIYDLDNITACRQPYQVLKIPSHRVDALLYAQRKNFCLIEVQIKTFINRSQIEKILNKETGRRKFKFIKADSVAMEFVLNRIKAGKIFTTDRIALDDKFGPKIAGIRYYNWIRDIISTGTGYMMVTDYKGQLAGFYVIQEKGEILYAIIGGVLDTGVYPGLGVDINYSTLEYARRVNAKKIYSAVSLNNPSSLKAVLDVGYKVKEMAYVLVRHFD